MPRSAKDSEEEVDVKTTGRKTRLTDVGSTDTSLRRSTRIKSVKQNDSSPESNDNSNVSNTQTRITRKRTGTMDNTTAIEKQRVLRSRRNSVSSDVSETPEIDATAIGTPTKRNRNSIGNDMLSRTGSQRIKRLTRAGSESKSSPARVTRNTRATSMEPETDAKNRLIQKDEHDLTHTPVRTRRRTLIMSSEATVIEEKEEPLKVLMVTLDRTLPDVNETEETDLNDSTKLVQKSDSVSNKENTPDKKHDNINEEDDEDNISDDGPTTVTFSEARTEALNMIKRITDSVKANKEMKKKKRKENVEEMHRGDEFKNEKQLRNREIKAKQTDTQKTGIKRLPDELLENLSDIPLKSLKKRKISRREEQTLPSRTMSSLEDKKVKNTYVDDFVPLSSCGATTNFAVASIQKIKKKKKNPKIVSFKQKMLARNSRQPVSAYLMYLEKQKVSGNDNFSNKPY